MRLRVKHVVVALSFTLSTAPSTAASELKHVLELKHVVVGLTNPSEGFFTLSTAPSTHASELKHVGRVTQASETRNFTRQEQQ